MPEPKIDFEPEIDFQPDEKPSAISRFGSGLAALGTSMYNQVNEAGKHGAEQIREGDYPGAFHSIAGIFSAPLDMASQMMHGNMQPEAARTEGINQVGGLVGLPMDEARKAYNEGDYAGLAGMGTAAALLAGLPHGFEVLKDHYNRPPAPAPVVQSRAIRGLLPEHNETFAGPFIAGDAGVALNKPYTIDLSQPLPGDMQSGSGTIHPTEADGLNQIPPDLAARRGLSIGKPAYQFDKPFEHGIMDDVSPNETTIDFKPDEGISKMRVPNPDGEHDNIAMGGASPRVLDVIGTSLYSRDRPSTTVKELLQNSFDEHRIAGQTAPIRVAFNGTDMSPVGDGASITVRDEGRGMTPDELYTKFTNVGETGKGDTADASGGFGFAKAAPMLSGDYFKAESIINENGKRIRYTFEGTPDQLKNQGKGVHLQRQDISPDVPTGLSVTTYYPKNTSLSAARRLAENMTKYSPSITSPVKIAETTYTGNDFQNEFLHGRGAKRSQYEDDYVKDYEKKPPEQLMDTIKLPGSDINIHYNEPPVGTEASNYQLHILNKGLYQESQAGNYGLHPLANVLENITADIKATVEEGSPGYPFTANREQLDKSVTEGINKWVEDNIVSGAREKQKKQLEGLYKSMPKFDIGTTNRPSVLFDSGNRLTPEELTHFQSSPIIKDLANVVDVSIDDILRGTKIPSWGKRVEKTGIYLDPGSYGLHIPNPFDRTKSTILINPLQWMVDKSPDVAALETAITMMHEVAHVGTEGWGQDPFDTKLTPQELADPRIGRYLQSYLQHVQNQGGLAGHGMDFIKRLGHVYAKFGPESTFGVTDDIHALITDESGGYNPEVQKLLSIYKDSRGRTATTEDFLRRTGVKRETPKSGEGNIPGDANPNGKRTDKRTAKPIESPEAIETKEIADTTVKKIVQAIHDASLPREEQEAIYTKTRGQRMGRALRVKDSGQAGFQKQLGKLSGRMKHVGVEPLGNSLEQPEIDSLFDHVTNSGLDFWKQITAKRAISKLLTGEHVPQRNELKLLRQVFGNQLADTIELHAALFVPPTGSEARAAITNTANVMKSFMTSIDFSAPLRQGLPLIGRKEFWGSLLGMVKSGFSEEYFKQSQEGLRDRPLFDMGENVGLKLTELSGDITKREESFISDLAERTPYVGRFVRGSNRAYVDFLNHLRADSFDNLIKDAGVIAKNGDEGIKIASDLAKFINVSTGRGDLGRLERVATDLNTVLFSPRMIASRLTMLNPMYYERLNPMVRKQALKALFSVAAAGGTFVGLGVAAGGKTSTDPTSADFMKLRLGNVRLDPYAGFQQYIVAFNRLLAGIRSGQDVTVPMKQFGENKLSPMASFIDTLAKGQNAFPPGGLGGAIGPNKVSGELINRFTPMILGDIIDVAKENPELLPLTVPLGVLGMSTQDYPDKQTGGFRQMRMRKLH